MLDVEHWRWGDVSWMRISERKAWDSTFRSTTTEFTRACSFDAEEIKQQRKQVHRSPLGSKPDMEQEDEGQWESISPENKIESKKYYPSILLPSLCGDMYISHSTRTHTHINTHRGTDTHRHTQTQTYTKTHIDTDTLHINSHTQRHT